MSSNKPTLNAVRWIALVVTLALSMLAYLWLRRTSQVQYVTEPVALGSIVRSLTATGTVNPVITVQVGTYVSGPITALYVDFNSPVKAGQLMAKIDPRSFAAQVASASGALATAKAQLLKDRTNLAYQKLTYERDKELLKQAVASQDQLDNQLSVYNQAVAQVGLDKASIQQQEANLKQAELNLNYTNIVSPVDGTVVSRNIDVGQTVAASFQTPTLFLVAKDLTKMQVDTNTSESDIGGVNVAESAEFTVDAYPEKIFKGVVAQVRQAPITVQNVVTYDVVVKVANPEMLLRPGMTAKLTIVTDRRAGVLRVPLQALRFSPHRWRLGSTHSGNEDHYERSARVWVEEGTILKPIPIVRGLDDGTDVEVVSGNLRPGELVITDESHSTKEHPAVSLTLSPRTPH
jgi:HlyD family secretion protein